MLKNSRKEIKIKYIIMLKNNIKNRGNKNITSDGEVICKY